MNKRVSLVLVLTLILTLGAVASAFDPAEVTGPKTREILYPIITEAEAQLIAIRRGDIDVYPGLARPGDIELLEADPRVALTFDYGFHMFYFAFNQREEPMSDPILRQAMSLVVDREQIINQLFRGYMLPLAGYVPPSSPYMYEDVETWELDVARAGAMLDEAGYTMDSATGRRIDPATGEVLREMVILTPTYEMAPTSAELGRILARAFNSLGIPVKAEPMDFGTILARLDEADFDMYMLAWGLTRNPTYLYNFFHSVHDVPGGTNRTGNVDPEYDAAAERFWNAMSEEEAMEAAAELQQMLAYLQPYIPLYSRPMMDAFRTDRVKGWVPMNGYGAADYANSWTMYNIEPLEGDTIRWLLPDNPRSLNITTDTSAYIMEILGRTFDFAIHVHPETMEDVPGWATDWEIQTWDNDGVEATVIEVAMRDDVSYHDGVPFTSEHVKFSMEYLRDQNNAKYLSSVSEVVEVVIIDDYNFRVYFESPGMWHLYAINAPMLPKHIWEGQDHATFQPWLEPHPTVEGMTAMVGNGPFMFDEFRSGEFIRILRYDGFYRMP